MFTRSSYFANKGVPPRIASYVALAFLIYGVLDSPLAQPCALIGGHVLSGTYPRSSSYALLTASHLSSSSLPHYPQQQLLSSCK
ncbi:hypothetical protein BKA70DRAFT_1259325 [Coprinopsis sp. MPI-PUGE-AT-0042]|nr:hypothetical protein BKA70DRAFT_1259325 [Coprinopsis sp. MPI-PUGE-AT-0042]